MDVNFLLCVFVIDNSPCSYAFESLNKGKILIAIRKTVTTRLAQRSCFRGRVGKGLPIHIHFLLHEKRKCMFLIYMFYTCVEPVKKKNVVLEFEGLMQMRISGNE
jgi:hypothetical protein